MKYLLVSILIFPVKIGDDHHQDATDGEKRIENESGGGGNGFHRFVIRYRLSVIRGCTSGIYGEYHIVGTRLENCELVVYLAFMESVQNSMSSQIL